MLAATALPASAAAPDTSACKSGGYANYMDMSTRKAFANQGRCVSTVAKGGSLVPVVVPILITGFSGVALTDAPDACYNTQLTLSGPPNTTHTVVVTGTSARPSMYSSFVNTSSRTFSSEGTLSIALGSIPKGMLVTVSVDGGELITAPVVSC